MSEMTDSTGTDPHATLRRHEILKASLAICCTLLLFSLSFNIVLTGNFLTNQTSEILVMLRDIQTGVARIFSSGEEQNRRVMDALALEAKRAKEERALLAAAIQTMAQDITMVNKELRIHGAKLKAMHDHVMERPLAVMGYAVEAGASINSVIKTAWGNDSVSKDDIQLILKFNPQLRKTNLQSLPEGTVRIPYLMKHGPAFYAVQTANALRDLKSKDYQTAVQTDPAVQWADAAARSVTYDVHVMDEARNFSSSRKSRERSRNGILGFILTAIGTKFNSLLTPFGLHILRESGRDDLVENERLYIVLASISSLARLSSDNWAVRMAAAGAQDGFNSRLPLPDVAGEALYRIVSEKAQNRDARKRLNRIGPSNFDQELNRNLGNVYDALRQLMVL